MWTTVWPENFVGMKCSIWLHTKIIYLRLREQACIRARLWSASYKWTSTACVWTSLIVSTSQVAWRFRDGADICQCVGGHHVYKSTWMPIWKKCFCEGGDLRGHSNTKIFEYRHSLVHYFTLALWLIDDIDWLTYRAWMLWGVIWHFGYLAASLSNRQIFCPYSIKLQSKG